MTAGGAFNILLRIDHDTQGRVFTHLYDQYPVSVDIDYTSYSITYHYIDVGQTGSNVNLTPAAGEDVLRVGLVDADRTTLTTGTPTIFVRYTEPTTNRVVEHLVSSVTVPTGANQANGNGGFQYVDLALDGRTIAGAVAPPTNTDVTILVDGIEHPITTHSSLSVVDGTDSWTMAANQTDRTLTIALNGTNAFRLTRQADGTVDLAVTGTLQANQTIT